jgi:methylase of polypeptide subunit release factors
LNAQIFPSGEVWLPTNEQYIMDYKSILDRETASPISMLDIGCGSGVLSFLFAKAFKKAKVFGVDNNPNAVKTFNLNASRLDFKNAQAFQHDIKKVD